MANHNSHRTRVGTRATSGTPLARRAHALDEAALQERSVRLSSGEAEVWKPSGSGQARRRPAGADRVGSTPGLSTHSSLSASRHDAHHRSAPSRWRTWFRIACWVLIGVSACSFFVIMWLPTHPLWLVVTVAAVFIVGILSLYIVSPDAQSNELLDEHGTSL